MPNEAAGMMLSRKDTTKRYIAVLPVVDPSPRISIVLQPAEWEASMPPLRCDYGVMSAPALTMNAHTPPPAAIGLLSFVAVPGLATPTRYSSGAVLSCSAEYVALALSSAYSNCHRPPPVIGALSLVDAAGAANATS